MDILSLLDLGLKIIDKLNLGADKAVTFYKNVKAVHPNDVPELTDAQVIERAKGAFQANIDDIDATLTALRGDNVAALRVTQGSGAIPAENYAEQRKASAPFPPSTGGAPPVEYRKGAIDGATGDKPKPPIAGPDDPGSQPAVDASTNPADTVAHRRDGAAV